MLDRQPAAPSRRECPLSMRIGRTNVHLKIRANVRNWPTHSANRDSARDPATDAPNLAVAFVGIVINALALIALLPREQTRILLEDVGKIPKQVVVDLGFRGVDHENPELKIIHRGKYKSLTRTPYRGS